MQIRKVLVVAQFAISIALMIATGVVLSQLRYVQTKDLGYDRENNLIASLPFQMDGSTYRLYPPFRDALRSSPAIQSTTISSRIPTGELLDGNGYRLVNPPNGDADFIPLRDVRVGFDFFAHYGIDLLAGRRFDASRGDALFAVPLDESNAEPVQGQAIVNESAARRLGYAKPEDAIGQLMLSGEPDGFHVRLEIVGVAADINFASLHEDLRPVVYSLSERSVTAVSIKTAPGRLQEAYDHLEAAWNQLFPGVAPSISFLDERFDAMYRQERRQAEVFAIFAALAILVACLGLFGLASFTTERRTKEIGIRKVMGASVGDIVLLLTREFTVLVVIANLIAWPVAWYFMSDWLTRFAFRIDLGPLLFGAAALAALIVAWLTVATQAGKAAMSRPVRSLRYE